MKVFVELEFDEENLGEKWMNIDNLKLLLYSTHATKPNLLEVVTYIEEDAMDKVIETLFGAPEVYDLFVVGHVIEYTELGGVCDVIGIYSSQDEAEARCYDSDCFVGPMVLNKTLPKDIVVWEDCYFPKKGEEID
ncbi:MAG: hypothetical protein PVG39_02500 [Desulfobacteraceae bacterium]|jgi:hypothetical protein